MSFFSRYKILAHLERLNDFYDGKARAPVTVDLEPCNRCNLQCYWCYPTITGWRDKCKDVMDADLLMALPKFLDDWGVKGLVLTGGGEPFLHKNIPEFLDEFAKTKMELGIITNGVLATPERLEKVIDSIRWIGFSIDAGTKKLYDETKGQPLKSRQFEQMLDNAAYIADHPHVQFTYKFLITPRTYQDIPKAVRLAKRHGFSDIYFRPAIATDEPMSPKQTLECCKMLEEAKELADEDFEVLTNFEKVSLSSSQVLSFPKCLATPTLLTICADGGAYWCQDHRGEESHKLCDLHESLDQLKEVWGSEEHRAAIEAIKPCEDCLRCTFNSYNEILNNLDPLTLAHM